MISENVRVKIIVVTVGESRGGARAPAVFGPPAQPCMAAARSQADGIPLPRLWPCVDCGLMTGLFCVGRDTPCYAADRMPAEPWAGGLFTPFCIHCDRVLRFCHFCGDQSWCAPPPHLQDGRSQQTQVTQKEKMPTTQENTSDKKTHKCPPPPPSSCAARGDGPS